MKGHSISEEEEEEKLRCHHCIHLLDGELPRMEVIGTLETLLDLPETAGACPGLSTREEESRCCQSSNDLEGCFLSQILFVIFMGRIFR